MCGLQHIKGYLQEGWSGASHLHGYQGLVGVFCVGRVLFSDIGQMFYIATAHLLI